MMDEHTELHWDATSHSNKRVLTHALLNARNRCNPSYGDRPEIVGMWDVSDDDFDMLDRLLRHAKYLAYVSDFTLKGSPIEPLLNTEAARDKFVAEQRAAQPDVRE